MNETITYDCLVIYLSNKYLLNTHYAFKLAICCLEVSFISYLQCLSNLHYSIIFYNSVLMKMQTILFGDPVTKVSIDIWKKIVQKEITFKY